jgi:hypothetical protein
MGLHVVLAACGPSAGEITDVRVSTCAEDGPALLEERFIAIAAWMVDERLVIGGFELDPDDDPPDDPYPELRSMGACGEAPSVLLRGKLDVRVVDDLLLACDESGRVNRIGPHGMRPPERLFERVSCRFETTSAGLIAHDPVQEAILLRPAPEQDGIEVVTSAATVRCEGPHKGSRARRYAHSRFLSPWRRQCVTGNTARARLVGASPEIVGARARIGVAARDDEQRGSADLQRWSIHPAKTNSAPHAIRHLT